MIICDEFWDKFIKVSKEYLKYNKEAEVYDVLNLIREKVNGGRRYTDQYLEEIDKNILEEEHRGYARSHSFS